EVLGSEGRVLDADRDRLVYDEVGVGEVDDLVALGGDRDAGGDHVELALRQGGEDAVPAGGLELRDAVDAFADGVDDVDVEADDDALRVDRFEGRVRRVRADDQGAAAEVLGGGERRHRQRCE